MTATPGTFGVRSMTTPLRGVALRSPTTVGDFVAAGWRRPDPALLLAQHERLAELLAARCTSTRRRSSPRAMAAQPA